MRGDCGTHSGPDGRADGITNSIADGITNSIADGITNSIADAGTDRRADGCSDGSTHISSDGSTEQCAVIWDDAYAEVNMTQRMTMSAPASTDERAGQVHGVGCKMQDVRMYR